MPETNIHRFASITYGRPISIDESDCNVAMPGDVYESVDFKDTGTTNRVSICFSTYQRELNKLYMIASPAIKQVYSAREAVGPAQARAYVSLLERVTEQLWQWRQALPNHLSLDVSQDCNDTLDPGSKAHRLQSLSLHLTFDSLLIILHRPFLKRHLSALQRHGLGTDHGFGVSGLGASEVQAEAPYSRSSSEGAFLPPVDTSEQQWWNAAARTAKVVELPQLAQFASEGHLIAFLAINLFNAAIVMVVLALSDPLSDRAQEAKRAIARIHRLQSRLGAHSTLSKRSLVILRNLVVLLSQRESDAILAPMGESTLPATGRMSVRDTLAMPIGGSTDGAPTNGLQQSTNADTQYASRLDDSLASVQRGKPRNSFILIYLANTLKQLPFGQTQPSTTTLQDRNNVQNSQHIRICYPPKALCMTCVSLPSMRATSRLSLMDGVRVLQMRTMVCIGSGMRAGMSCTETLLPPRSYR